MTPVYIIGTLIVFLQAAIGFIVHDLRDRISRIENYFLELPKRKNDR